MKENISCAIIQDLLPNYIDRTLSDTSKDLVANHLDKCVDCKNEFENMNSLIEVTPVKEIELDYLKKVHKKCRNILLACIILIFISFITLIFISEPNADEATFTLVLYLIVILITSIKFLFPLLGSIVSILSYKKSKKKWLLAASIVCTCIFLYSIISVINSLIKY